MKYVVFTLDLESDYSGHVSESYDAWNKRYIDELILFLHQENIPLTIFVVGKTLSEHPLIIKRLEKYTSDFHLHSYSHNLDAPDSREEIEKGIHAFRYYFKRKPKGYRAPEGRISESGWKILAENGIAFDSSIFPSFWPRPRYLKYSREPFFVAGTSLLEIPFATVSPFRFIVSLSWMKLLGWKFYFVCISLFGLPDIVIFNIHLHDLWLLPSYSTLPLHWRMVYGRNHTKSFAYMSKFLKFLRTHGYTGVTASHVAKTLVENQIHNGSKKREA